MSVAPFLYILLAAAVLIIPIRWIAAIILASFIHELFHCLAVMILGGRINHIHIGINGAVMECSSLQDYKLLICTLAGPFGGIAFSLLGEWIPYTAFCCLIHSAYNLLPIYPLDGGRAMEYMIGMIIPDWYGKNKRLLREYSVVAVFAIALIAALVFRIPYLTLALCPICLEKYLANHRK